MFSGPGSILDGLVWAPDCDASDLLKCHNIVKLTLWLFGILRCRVKDCGTWMLLVVTDLGPCHTTGNFMKVVAPIDRAALPLTTQTTSGYKIRWCGCEERQPQILRDSHWKPMVSVGGVALAHPTSPSSTLPGPPWSELVAGSKLEVAWKVLLAAALAAARLVRGHWKLWRGYRQVTSNPSPQLEMACWPCGTLMS